MSNMKIATFVIAGAACGLASAQSDLDIERAYSAELMADAANRSSLLQGAGEGSGAAGVRVQLVGPCEHYMGICNGGPVRCNTLRGHGMGSGAAV